VEIFANIILKKGFTMFGAEHKVDAETREGLGHRFESPFQGWGDWGIFFPRALPRVNIVRTVGAGEMESPIDHQSKREIIYSNRPKA
jgi:hypothetical protein